MNDDEASRRAAKSRLTYLIVGLLLISLPGLILGYSAAGFDETGLMTTIMMLMLGVPSGIAGLVLIIIGMTRRSSK